MDEQRIRKIVLIFTPLVLYLFLWTNGVLGIDFGRHWDEALFSRQAVYLLTSSSYFPNNYFYGSLCYYLVFWIAKIYVAVQHMSDVSGLVEDGQFQIVVRLVFISISCLTVIWVYRIAYRATGNYLAALISGLIICASYEFSYHSRWGVTDGITVQFATLSTLLLFLDTSITKRVVLSALVAGVAAGTKFTAGIVCINILFLMLHELQQNKDSMRKVPMRLFLATVCFLGSFLLTTPGLIFDNGQFMQNIVEQRYTYSHGHLGYTTPAGPEHLLRMSDYIVFALFSRNDWISALIFLCACTGFVAAARQRKWLHAGLFFTMVIYILYLSIYHLMIVRNLLFVLPFLACAAGIGIHNIRKWMPSGSRVVVPVLLVALLFSCGQVLAASLGIYKHAKVDLASQLREYRQNHKEMNLKLSIGAAALVSEDPAQSAPPGSYLVFLRNEVWYQLYRANIRNQFYSVLGTQEVNLDYYPSWAGDDKLVIMKAEMASHDILFYTLRGEKARLRRKFTCDLETVDADSAGFAGLEWLHDSMVNPRIEKLFLGGVGTISHEVTHSGTQSLKLDKRNPNGVHCNIPVKRGGQYVFSVWRKDPLQKGVLVIANNEINLWRGIFEGQDKRPDGWELLRFEYIVGEDNVHTLSVDTWQPDTTAEAFFDDFTIEMYEVPPPKE